MNNTIVDRYRITLSYDGMRMWVRGCLELGQGQGKRIARADHAADGNVFWLQGLDEQASALTIAPSDAVTFHASHHDFNGSPIGKLKLGRAILGLTLRVPDRNCTSTAHGDYFFDDHGEVAFTHSQSTARDKVALIVEFQCETEMFQFPGSAISASFPGRDPVFFHPG